MKNYFSRAALVLFSALALHAPAQAQAMPEITPSLKKMLGALPIADLKDDVQKMVGALKKTGCGGDLTGCYATKSGPLQLYFFTSKNAQQTFLLVINKRMAMPKLLKDNVQTLLGGTYLSDPIISISTTDFSLDTVHMPADLQKVVRDSYFNVDYLAFSSGVQLAARADLGGGIKKIIAGMGVKADQMTLRAGVVMPIPTDLASGAGAGAGLADSMKHGDTMKKAGADALKPQAYVEFQLAPGSTAAMLMPQMTMTDMTLFIDNALTFGYKGNARFNGTTKDILLHFQTPLTPAGGMDLLDFSFRMAMPQSFTLEDQVHMAVAMALPDSGMTASPATASLTKLGGGFIGNIKTITKPLLTVVKPLSVFQLRNPKPAAPYQFGNRSKPFPTTDDPFNVILLGPLADGGPLMYVNSDVRILGQTMGKIEVSVGKAGFHGTAQESITIKLGPLGKTRIKLQAKADVTGAMQDISLKGNLAGQAMALILSGETLTIDFSASCINPFEIKAKVAITDSLNIADVFEGQGGVNVDPSKLQGCIGKELEAALGKIAGEYKSLGGYTANQANAALNKIAGDATAAANKAAKEAKDAADAEAARAKAAADAAAKAAKEAADAAAKGAKEAARQVANQSSNVANNAFKEAGNAFKGIGKKKKHHHGPDPKFAASVFDWDFYYDHNADVVNAGVDLASHWRDSGFNEGRQGSLEFNARYYLNRYPDIQQSCGGSNLQCALEHWLNVGIDQGRQGSPGFSVASYLNRYGDLQNAFGKDNFSDALDHWLNSGVPEGRDGRPDSATAGPISGPKSAGGGGGTAWSDSDTCGGQQVSAFRLRYGGSVDTIQFGYLNRGWAEPHGYTSNGPFRVEVYMTAGEYIVQVDYGSGSRVDNITFRTNLGRTFGPYGGGGANGSYTVTPGEKLGCIAGRAGSSVDQLIFSSTGPR